MKHSFFSFPLILCALFVSSLQAQPDRAIEAMADGQAAYESGRFQDAKVLFERALRLDRNLPDAYTYLGNIHFISGDFAMAESNYSRALEQLLRASRQNPQGSYQEGGVTILDPVAPGLSPTTFATLYNNRGAANYRLGNLQDAQLDFQDALSYDADLPEANQNLNNLAQGKTAGATTPLNQRKPAYGTGGRTSYSGRYATKYPQRRDTKHQRPASLARSQDLRAERNAAEEIRENRVEIYDLQLADGTSRGGFLDIFSPKEFESRRVSSRGKLYREPAVLHASHSYLSIDEVKILPRATQVTVRVKNPGTQTYQVSVHPPSREESYYISDRSGNSRRKVRLIKVDGIKTYPDATDLAANETLVFVLTFEKIPDDMGFINIIEGAGSSEAKWNFYGVDLTR
jgi:tetratricopeptide (TPR) repeat protein